MSDDLHHEMMLALRVALICLKNRDQNHFESKVVDLLKTVIAKGEAHNNAKSLPNNAGEEEV